MNADLRLIPPTDLSLWAELWEKCYSDLYKDDQYDENLRLLNDAKDEASFLQAIEKLFQWKNGSRLSQKKAKAVSRIRFALWLKWKKSEEIPTHFPGGIVWNIFLSHLLTNGRRPIFDQHTWRAYCFLTNQPDGIDGELSKQSIPSQMNCFSEYEKWFLTQSTVVPARKLDRALMAFGQFLKSPFRPLLSVFSSVSSVNSVVK